MKKLSEMESGSSGTVFAITSHDAARLEGLTALGIFPGTRIRVQQTRPSFILEVGHTHIAIEKQVAEAVIISEEGPEVTGKYRHHRRRLSPRQRG